MTAMHKHIATLLTLCVSSIMTHSDTIGHGVGSKGSAAKACSSQAYVIML